jgi:hypothetical protein
LELVFCLSSLGSSSSCFLNGRALSKKNSDRISKIITQSGTILNNSDRNCENITRSGTILNNSDRIFIYICEF